ncbi:hypothetical protein [Hymenobacter persicinus]|nr:hypothetical protein [Hymenobacter persicinus]
MSIYDGKGFKGKLLVGVAIGVLLLVMFSIYWVLTKGYAWLSSH